MDKFILYLNIVVSITTTIVIMILFALDVYDTSKSIKKDNETINKKDSKNN